jgi:S1-C subfamily serine protease
VIENATYIAVIQKDKVTEGRLVKASPESDRCILAVYGAGLTPVPGVRRYRDLSVGERVYTVGTPSGLEQTLGEGLISGLREYKSMKLIQTSAPISPGSSGGGLFDSRGNLVGVTTFLLRDAQSLNFAIAAEEYWR